MVMHKQNGSGGLLEGRGKHLARMDNAGIEAAFGNLHFLDQTVFTVEQQGQENFLAIVAQALLEVLKGVPGLAVGLPGLEPGGAKLTSDLEQCLDLRRFGWSDAQLLAQFGNTGLSQPAQGAEAAQQSASQVDRAGFTGRISRTDDQ